MVDPNQSAAFDSGNPPIIVVAQLRTPLATAIHVYSFPTWQHECHIAKLNSFRLAYLPIF